MIRDEAIIREINALWLPVYPYMADHLLATSGVRSGRFLDLGPFAGGLAVNVLQKCETLTATVIDESEVVLRWVEEEAAWAAALPDSPRAGSRRSHPRGGRHLRPGGGARRLLLPDAVPSCRR